MEAQVEALKQEYNEQIDQLKASKAELEGQINLNQEAFDESLREI